MSGITIDKLCDLKDADGDSLDINADGSLNVTISGQSNVYAEDSAHTTGDDGNFSLAVRQDTKASTAGTDGDYAAFIQNASGELYVVDEAGNTAIAAGNALLTTIDADTSLLSAATQLEDAVSAGGERLVMIGGYRQDADTSPVSADGDFHGFIFNDLGQLKVEAQLDSGCNDTLTITRTVVDNTVGGTQLVTAMTGRREVTVQNLGAESIFVKDGTGVTSGEAGNGFEVPSCSSATYAWGDNFDLYAITPTATGATVKIIECK